jgi:hypothetical protein
LAVAKPIPWKAKLWVRVRVSETSKENVKPSWFYRTKKKRQMPLEILSNFTITHVDGM